MKFKFSICILFVLAFLCMNNTVVISQDLCTPVGWATQNGGTTGGGTATPITVSTLTDLQAQANSVGAKVIYVSGTMGTGVATRVVVAANKTIIGLPGATLIGGFDIKSSNVILRNMKVQGPGSVDVNGVDCITIDGATNVWVDHCDLYDGQDGDMDIVNGANYIAVTWCKFYYTSASTNHQFCNLLGNSDSKTSDRTKLKITMMYNWWANGVVERMPRVRFGQVHVVNNYFSSRQASYCVRAGIEADILVESNYFDSTKTPIDLYQNNFTAVTSRNNYVVATTGNNLGSGTSFTPPYSLTITPAANVKSIVSNPTCGAGATMASPTACGCGGTPITFYNVTTSAAPAAGGTVTGGGSFASGATATLTATRAIGYVFTGWSGDASGTTSPVSVVVNANKNVVANFVATSYTLTTAAAPVAGGTVSGGGSYGAGATATITAVPAAGYTFAGWSGASTATTASTTIVMNSNATVTANFKAITVVNYTLTTAANPVAGGSVSGAGTYVSGSTATVIATPAAGYSFIGWSGASTATTPSTTIAMIGNLSVTANFILNSGTNSTIRIEDSNTPTTGLCSYEGALSSNSGANNTKVINLTNSTAKGINYKIVVPTAGAYSFNWRYVNSSTNNVFTMRLIVNGVVVNTALGFPRTSGSTVFANTITSINLIAGSNTIRIESVNGTATADIDWLEVTGNSPAVGNCTVAKSTAIINEQTIGENLVFPNPAVKGQHATLKFNISNPQNISTNITNAEGVKIKGFNKFYSSTEVFETITTEGIKPGVYYINIKGDNGLNTTRKWVVM
jgi:pectate lyase